MRKTIFITGATDGIGLLTAQKLIAGGHQVLLHGRHPDKLNRISASLDGAPTYCADLSVIDEVTSLSSAILAEYQQLDVLINNAGVLKTTDTKTKTGRDVRFEVNTLSPYILTQNLLNIIPKSGRIINLSSAAQAPVDIEAMMEYKAMEDMAAYAQSKLAMTIWSAQLAATMPNGPICVSVNPGSLLASKMVKEGFGIEGKDLNIGADILVRAALSADFSNASGMHFDNDRGEFAAPHQAANDGQHVEAVMATISDITQKFINE
jgi:NAD(P)-dependent dehydrogenase (short-subunit alcohol dehydrogenase family)